MAEDRYAASQRRDARGGSVGTVEQGADAGRVIFTLREHPLFALAGLWPTAVGLVGWLLLDGLSQVITGAPLPASLQIGILALIGAVTLRWLVLDALDWYVRRYVLTEQWLTVTWGVLFRRRQQAAVSQIQNVRVNRPNVIANLLDMGDVDVQTAGATGDLKLAGVSHPQLVARTISMTQQAPRAAQSQLDERIHPAARAALNQLVVQEHGSDDQTDGTLSPDPDDIPRAGLFRRQIAISLLPSERVMTRLYRHWFVLALKLVAPFGVTIGLMALGLVLRATLGVDGGGVAWITFGVASLVGLVWAGLMVSNYVDDVFILTTHRIIDIDRQYFVLAEARREAMYTAVQNVSVKVPLLGRLFGYGHIVVETAGQAPNIDMVNMGRPLDTQSRIFALMAQDKKRRARADARAKQHEIHQAVGMALSALIVAVPDVRERPVTAAVSALRHIGLGVTIAAEKPSATATPGTVMEQTPRPGAAALVGGEVQLTIARTPIQRPS